MTSDGIPLSEHVGVAWPADVPAASFELQACDGLGKRAFDGEPSVNPA